MNRFQFVADYQRRHGVKRLCAVPNVARSSYYYWRATASNRASRHAADARLAVRIRVVHRESDGTYGAPRITAELRETGERVNHKKVARVMRSIDLAGVRLRRRHRTTVADPATVKAPDLIGRDFTAAAVNTKYVGDITYLPLDGGKFRYLATVIDLASRRLTGWAIAGHMRTELVTDALAAAQRTRGCLTGAIMHTDHGSQYKSQAFAEACRSAGVRQSMGAIGSSADNALAEFQGAVERRRCLGCKSLRNGQVHTSVPVHLMH
ncbi:IS3 family transposase [Streptomyces chryseus]